MRNSKAKKIRGIVYGDYSYKAPRKYVYLKATMRKREIIDQEKLKSIPLLERLKAKFLGTIDKIMPKTQVVTGTFILDPNDRISHLRKQYKHAKHIAKMGVSV